MGSIHDELKIGALPAQGRQIVNPGAGIQNAGSGTQRKLDLELAQSRKAKRRFH
jgi:hypothetical protein